MNRVVDTGYLIRKLSRRQWAVSLAVVALALASMFLGWRGFAEDQQTAEILNQAGRQRMLSQRMAMYLVLQQGEADPARRRDYRDMAAAAATEFARSHERLAETARRLGQDSAIHSMYFGPLGSIDAESRRFLSLVRAAIEASALARPIEMRDKAAIVAAASDGLIKDLHKVTALYQRHAEQRFALALRLLQVSGLLIVGLMTFSLFRVFRPVIRHLADDVEARDRAEHSLKESEERFRAFSECSSDWFWQTDAQHRFTWTQGNANVTTPMSRESVLGKTRLELRPDIEKAAVEKWQTYQQDLDARRPLRDFEYQIRSDDGADRWISVSGQPFFDDQGSFLGYRGTAKYIQASKDIEAALLRLEMAIEQSPVSIMITDADSRIIYVNTHFTAASGYSAGEAIGHTPKILSSGQMPESLFRDMRRALGEGSIWRGEICNRRKSGEWYWESQSISPVLDPQGSITHFVAVSEDITAQRTIARREQSRNRILEVIASGARWRNNWS